MFIGSLLLFTGINIYYLTEKPKTLLMFSFLTLLLFGTCLKYLYQHMITMFSNLTYFESISWNRNWVFMNSENQFVNVFD
jgi:hypothetical protein